MIGFFPTSEAKDSLISGPAEVIQCEMVARDVAAREHQVTMTRAGSGSLSPPVAIREAKQPRSY